MWCDWRVRILAIAVGSRGDVEPIIALGLGLQAAGHEVRIATNSDAIDFVTSHGLDAVNAGPSTLLITEGPGKKWMSGSSRNRLQEAWYLRTAINGGAEAWADGLLELAGSADVYLSSFLTVEGVDVITRRFGGLHIAALLFPLLASQRASALMYPALPQRNSPVNYHAGRATERALGQIMSHGPAVIRARLGEPYQLASDLAEVLRTTPTVLGISPTVVPEPDDWPATVHVTGPWRLPVPAGYTPPDDLAEFLAAGEPPVYIGFGSMRDGGNTQQIITEAIAKAGRRVMLNRGWAQLVAELPDVFAVGDCPHAWLFPQMAGIIHHGGAGTTHNALASGRPSVVIPHLGDQFFWGRRTTELGVGPVGIPRQKLTSDRLAKLITDIDQPRFRATAAALRPVLLSENGVEFAVQVINKTIAEAGLPA